MENRSISHTHWKCQYHIAFIPKYCNKVLDGKTTEDVREIISILCKYKDVAIPLKLSISNFMGYLKEKSILMIYDRHSEIQSKWDKTFWVREYYVEYHK